MENGYIAHFRLLEKIGEGNIGVVFKAYDESLRREVAIRVLKEEFLSDSEILQTFLAEAQTAAGINHSNIVQIYFCGQLPNGCPYVVMELVTGQTLEDMIEERTRLPEAMAIEIAIEAVEGLRAAHELGLIHGDLHTGNLFIDQRQKLKILDFGFSRVGALIAARKGMLWGNPHYISPERASGQVEDHRTDIYSLGSIFYQAIASHPPFKSRNVNDLVQKRLHEKPTELIEIVAGVHSCTSRIVSLMLQGNPQMRYDNYDLLLKELYQAQKVVVSGKVQTKKEGINSRRRTQKVLEPKETDSSVMTRPKKSHDNRSKLIVGVAGICILFLVLMLAVAKLRMPSGQSTKAIEDVTVVFCRPGSVVPEENGRMILKDVGETFGPKGKHHTYGWSQLNDEYYFENKRAAADKPLYRFSHDFPSSQGVTWEMEVPNGNYNVEVVGSGSRYAAPGLCAEGVPVAYGVTRAEIEWIKGSKVVRITDGKLTLQALAGSLATRICYVRIRKTTIDQPSPAPVLPVVKLPSSNLQAKEGDNLPIRVDYAGPGIAEGKIRLFANTELLCEIDRVPFSYTWTNMPVGRHWIRCEIRNSQDECIASLPEAVTVFSKLDNIVGDFVRINFQYGGLAHPQDYLVDYGDPYGDRKNGFEYGFVDAKSKVASSQNFLTRSPEWTYEVYAPDLRYFTSAEFRTAHLIPSRNVPWELKVPNGKYRVRLVSGVAAYKSNSHRIRLHIEDQLALDGFPDKSFWIEGINDVEVKDGRLTVSVKAEKDRAYLNFIEISSLGSE